ncbi:protein of unknown function [Sterolibacterium denitrificans]|uniref:Uncharacterized protein n=1 Tax=Sterolibacterium denitrificans TaxID=157592 RepID=A0A7Z7HRX3_9PROT|nr:protein of unknown function [Sterolibacterium denitrificans]
MHKDALVQLGIVSVSLNTSQKEKHFRRRMRHTRLSARRRCLSARNIAHRRAMLPIRLYPMQDQVCHSRTPA